METSLFAVLLQPLRNRIALGVLLALSAGAGREAGRTQQAERGQYDERTEADQQLNDVHRGLRWMGRAIDRNETISRGSHASSGTAAERRCRRCAPTR